MILSAITLISLTASIMLVLYTLLARYKKQSLKEATTQLFQINGITKGMLLVLLFVAGMFLSISAVKASDVSFFNSTTLFVGLDHTNKLSPMCHEGGANDRLTSNVGLSQNLLVINDVHVDAEYTHHSCAISEDDKQYDAIGVKLSYTWY